MLARHVISCAQGLECARACWHHGAYLPIKVQDLLALPTRCSIDRGVLWTFRNEKTREMRITSLRCGHSSRAAPRAHSSTRRPSQWESRFMYGTEARCGREIGNWMDHGRQRMQVDKVHAQPRPKSSYS